MTESIDLYALIAPVGQLTGNGQLRETISERRNRKGEDVPFWYISSDLATKLGISDKSSVEAVIADELTAINWLQLRFGGEIKPVNLDVEKLRQYAMELPPIPFIKDISDHNSAR